MFDTNALMKISRVQFMDFVSKGINSGVYTVNEARKEMNMSPRLNGDLTQLPVNAYFLDEQGNIILPSQQNVEKEVVKEEDVNIEEE